MTYVLHRVVGSRTVLRSVDQRNLRIGRGAGCELRLEDTAVSLEHALIREDPSEGQSRYQLTDLGSVTGTYVNGEPVSTALLRDGDEVGVGGFLIRVRRSDPEDPLFLHVRPADAEPRPDAPAIAVESIDYGRRYRLRRRLWTKGLIAAVLALVAVGLVAALPAARRTDAFQPGDLTSFHSGRIDAAECSACHTPWRGVADTSCQRCHGEGGIDAAPLHHPEAVAKASADAATLACTACHREHMGRDGLMPMNDAPCRSCHGGLALASGVEPLFAANVPSFAEHPELRLTVADSGGGGARGSGFRRVPVTDPEARRSDPTAIALNHAKHLAPGLLSPEGRVTLTCQDCHRLESTGATGAGAGRDLVPITFEATCERCHALEFDARSDEPAPHDLPERVFEALQRHYQEVGTEVPSAEQELLDALRGRNRRPASRLDARTEARRAERRVYENHCVDCHDIDPEEAPRPTVPPVDIPERWLPHARFSHGEHLRLEGLGCTACHAGAEASTETADVLLPTIASCTPCHADDTRGRAGETVAAEGASFPVTPGPSSCRTCHDYHSGNRFPGLAVAARAAARPKVGGP